MKKLFMGLSLILGFSAAWALDGTLKIQSEVEHPQTGQKITIDLGNYVFDVFRDRRELVQEVYNICKNPPEKIKTFIANRRNLRDNAKIDFNNPTSKSQYSKRLLYCSFFFENGKLNDLGEASYSYDKTLNEIVNKNIGSENFSDNFAEFIDSARADAKKDGVSFTTPNKTVSIKFGSRTIDATGAEGVATYPDFDYEFNVYDDRRELWKKTGEVCTKLQGSILNEIKNGNRNPSVSVWYVHPNGGLAELKSLRCNFYSDGTYTGYYIYKNDGYNHLKRASEMSKEDIEKWADRQSIVGENFNHDFMTLIDVANTSSKSSQKSSTKAKK